MVLSTLHSAERKYATLHSSSILNYRCRIHRPLHRRLSYLRSLRSFKIQPLQSFVYRMISGLISKTVSSVSSNLPFILTIDYSGRRWKGVLLRYFFHPHKSFKVSTDCCSELHVLISSSKFGLPEERDPNRLKDKNGSLVMCFRCGGSTLPDPTTVAGQSHPMTAHTNGRPKRNVRTVLDYAADSIERGWKNMVSCDYCSSSWHLDCLEPPMSTMPLPTKKWMCPNHVDQTIVGILSSCFLLDFDVLHRKIDASHGSDSLL